MRMTFTPEDAGPGKASSHEMLNRKPLRANVQEKQDVEMQQNSGQMNTVCVTPAGTCDNREIAPAWYFADSRQRMLGLLSHTCRNGKSSLIWVIRVEVQRAVVKFTFLILRALWSLGMPSVLLSCCLLSPRRRRLYLHPDTGTSLVLCLLCQLPRFSQAWWDMTGHTLLNNNACLSAFSICI